jgi:peptidoglycan/xylan/chitin deacetylase (PgdA/CDA1 family)
VRREIAWTQAQYELLRDELVRRAGAAGLDAEMAAVPPHMRLMRLPFGRCDERVLSMLARMGLVTLQWNVAAEGAPEELTIPQVVQRVAGQVKPGSVMLLHANGVIDQTSELLPPLVEELRRRGYAFVTGSELLTMGEPFAVPYCYSVTPGDNMIYDRLFPD